MESISSRRVRLSIKRELKLLYQHRVSLTTDGSKCKLLVAVSTKYTESSILSVLRRVLSSASKKYSETIY